MKIRLFIASLLTAVAAMAGFIPADDPNLQYTGRVDFSNPKAPEFSWAGTSVAAQFSGTSLKVKLNEKGHGMYYAFVDGNYDNGHVITCTAGEKTYLVAEGLENKPHDLLIYKRTDGGKGTTAFLGLELDEGAKLLPPGPRPKIRMEVYGDSISTGLGSDRKRGKEHSREATDNFFSYGSITARNIGAEFRCISKSGIGLVKSWWPTIMPQYYDRASATSLEGSGERWDFSTWTPDLVVINLFQNDSWTIKGAGKDVIIPKYVDFVNTLRGHYPKAKIVCALGSMSAGKNQWAGWVKEAVTRVNDAGDKEVYSYIFKVGTGNRHPNRGEHVKMATELSKFLTTIGLVLDLAVELPEEVTEVATNFTPDPAKTYYIDCPASGLRLAGDGAKVSQWGYNVVRAKGVKQSETGTNVRWKFIATGDKWLIQLAAGGENSRLWANKLTKSDGLSMSGEVEAGAWSQFKITGASNGKTFLTCPTGPKNFRRLRISDGGKIGMAKSHHLGPEHQLVISEVK